MKIPPAPDIIELPISRWRESRALRLHALRADPAAFASSHADELAFADDIWLSRMQSAIDRKGNMTFYAEVAGALVGMAGGELVKPRENPPCGECLWHVCAP